MTSSRPSRLEAFNVDEVLPDLFYSEYATRQVGFSDVDPALEAHEPGMSIMVMLTQYVEARFLRIFGEQFIGLFYFR